MSGEFSVSSAADVGRFFGYSRQTVYEWKTRGMPVQPDGRFDLSAIAQWREADRNKSSAAETDIEAAKLRDKIAVADTREFNLAIKRGLYVEKAVVIAEGREKAAKGRSRIQALPGELAASIPPEFRTDLVLVVSNFCDNLLRDISDCYSAPILSRDKPPTRQTSGRQSRKNGSPAASRRASRGQKNGSSTSSADPTTT